MSFWSKLFGAKHSGNSASARAEQRLSLRSPAHPAHALALEADSATDDQARLELIDRALALSPEEPHLLYAQACALERRDAHSKGPGGQIENFGKLHPSFFDIAMRRKNFGFVHPFPADWENVFDFESWSETCLELKGPMWGRFANQRHVQIVRHCLVPTIAIVSGAGKDVCARVKKMRWELRWASTPHGKMAVHYFLMDCGNNDTRKNEAFLPHGVSNPPHATDGFFLLQRLAQSEDCFLVLVEGDGTVHRNERFLFPESLKRTLRDSAKELDRTGPTPNPVELINRAGKWYKDHTDFDSIRF
jgi:hypothetical protein